MGRERVTPVSAIYTIRGERWLETKDKYLQYLSFILFERYCGEGGSLFLVTAG